MKHFWRQRLTSACLVVSAFTPFGLKAEEVKPNIIFVLLDDLDWLTTGPHLDKWMPFLTQKTALDGVRFESAHSAAICCEARAAILTGLYAHNNGVFTNGGTWGGYEAFRSPRDGAGRALVDKNGQTIDNEDRTLATALQAAGYRTGMFGKYLNGFERRGDLLPELPKGWDRGSVYIDPNLRSYLGYGYEVLNWTNQQKTTESFGFRPQDYATDVLTEKALEFLKEASPKPKFLYLSYTAPHLPLPPAPRHFYQSLQGLDTIPQLPNTFQDGVDGWKDKPQWLQASKDQRTRPELKAWMRHDWGNRLGSLLAVDEALQRLWQELEKQGQADRTIVVVSSDNGYNHGAHGLLHKMAPYEETLRVPLYIFGGKDLGLQRGLKEQTWTSHVDFYPTFLEAAAAPLPGDIDGKSLWPLLKGTPQPLRSELLFSYQGGEAANGRELPIDVVDSPLLRGVKGFLSDVPTHFGVKKVFAVGSEMRSFKLVAWPKRDQALFFENAWEEIEWELYDLDRDPYELSNLIYHKSDACRPLMNVMQEGLRELFRCSGNNCHPQLVPIEADELEALRACESP